MFLSSNCCNSWLALPFESPVPSAIRFGPSLICVQLLFPPHHPHDSRMTRRTIFSSRPVKSLAAKSSSTAFFMRTNFLCGPAMRQPHPLAVRSNPLASVLAAARRFDLDSPGYLPLLYLVAIRSRNDGRRIRLLARFGVKRGVGRGLRCPVSSQACLASRLAACRAFARVP